MQPAAHLEGGSIARTAPALKGHKPVIHIKDTFNCFHVTA